MKRPLGPLSFLVPALLVVALVLSGCGSSEKVIKIGSVAPMSGPNSLDGKYQKQGIELAIEDVQGALTLGGTKYTIQAFYEDDQGQPDTGANCFRKLVDQNKVFAIVGSPFSKVNLAGAPIANSAKVLTVASNATNPQVTAIGEYVFRAAFIDPFQGQVMAKFAKDVLKVTKVAVLYNNADDYSKGLAEAFSSSFKNLGGEIVEYQAYGGADIKDFNPQLVKIKASGAQAIMLPNEHPEVALQIQQARAMGITVPFLGGDSWDNPDLPKLAGEALEGAYITGLFSNDGKDPKVQAFVQRYQKKFGEPPNTKAVAAYDAATVILQAIAKTGKLDAKAVRDTLASQAFEGSCGVIKYDANRNPSRPAFIMQYVKGNLQYVDMIQP